METALLGRAHERRALESAIDAARSGLSATVVVHGEAGAGKTALLMDAARSAPDFEITHVAAPESEIELPYGGLNRLLSPFVVSTLDQLPTPTRQVLRSAFGLSSDSPGERHLVGLAALELLSALARHRPMLCVIDDAQWLDLESRDALVLIARRLGADRVAMLFGVRHDPGGTTWWGELPTLPVGGLAEPDAIELVNSVACRELGADEARRIARETKGSPMAIIELTTEFDDLADGRVAPEPVPMARQVEGHFLRRVRALPAEAQHLLLVAALDVSGDPQTIRRAAASLGVSDGAARTVSNAGLLFLTPDVHFRHPLVRSAVQRAASLDSRRRAHRALAEATDYRREPEQRAWHRSASAAAPDEEMASDLAELARQARRRGAHAAAGALLARAAELSVDDSQRVERVFAAASAYGAGGAIERARALLLSSAPLLQTPYDRARALRLHGVLCYDAGEARNTASMLLEAARSLKSIDVGEARAAVLQALAAARITGRFALPGEGVVAVSAAARAMPLPPGVEPTIVDRLLDGDATLFLEGHQAAVPLLTRALDEMRADHIAGPDALLWLAMGSWAAGAIGDDLALHELTGRLVEQARREGALTGLAHGLLYAAMSELFSGSLDTARSHFVERSHLLAAIGLPADVGNLITLAWAGRDQETRAEAKSIAAHATERCYGWMLIFVEYALCVLDLGLGNYRSAFAAAPKTYDESPFVCQMAFPDLIEAAVRCGERASAERALDELATRALMNQTPLALGLLARCRALLADGEDADPLYRESLEHLGRSRSGIQLARTRLLYGEWLRRRKRRVDARTELRAALDVFVHLGAAAFANRARRELEATGERARKRSADAIEELTPQEREIAELVARGATNAEAAQKLFLSAATVDYHLRKVYRKLGITSRRGLAVALTR